MTVFNHEVSVVAGGKTIPGWKSYQIEIDMLQPADAFSMEVQFTREAWKLLPTDTEVGVYMDRTRLCTCYIDSRFKRPSTDGGTNIAITGRDKAGRLLDESAPQFSYGGLHLVDLVKKIIGASDATAPFRQVTLVNTKNRRLLSGANTPQSRIYYEPISGGPSPIWNKFKNKPGVTQHEEHTNNRRVTIVQRPPIVTRPGILDGRKKAPKRVNPGQSRWAALEAILKEARLVAWSTGAGAELFVGVPNYDQAPQYLFHEVWDSGGQSNCEIVVGENTAEMYSMYTVIGAAVGTKITKTKDRRIRATIYQDPNNTVDGSGIELQRKKELIITDDSIRTLAEAYERAELELLKREANFGEIEVSIEGHSQLFAGTRPTLFAVDKMARVVDEATELDAPYLITALTLERSTGGTRTDLRLKPYGAILTL